MLNKSLNARYAMNQCARFTHQSQSYLRQLVFTQLINSYQHLWTKHVQSFTKRSRHADVIHMLDSVGTLSARSHQGFNSRLKGVARGLAVVIGISLSMAFMPRLEASIVPNKKLRELANYQLTDKQYQCHNQIVHRESSWNINAIGNKSGTKQTHGYYQIKSEHVKGKPYDYQFYMYWYYVSSRYGLDYEIPDYCKALHHLRTKGWQ
jgi:hypothetical protein